MNHLRNNLIQEIDDLIIGGCESYEDLPPSDKHKLAALYMDTMGRNTYECVCESDDFDVALHQLRQFLFSGEKDKAYELAETLRDNTEKYLSRSLRELYDERVSVVETELNIEAGLVPYQHPDNGEIAWMRR